MNVVKNNLGHVFMLRHGFERSPIADRVANPEIIVTSAYGRRVLGTRPDYLANRADQKNQGPFGERNCTEIEK